MLSLLFLQCRYDLKFTSSEVDLLWSKLPSEKDGLVSFEELVHHCFLNYNVTSNEGDNGQPGKPNLQGNKNFCRSLYNNQHVKFLTALKTDDSLNGSPNKKMFFACNHLSLRYRESFKVVQV